VTYVTRVLLPCYRPKRSPLDGTTQHCSSSRRRFLMPLLSKQPVCGRRGMHTLRQTMPDMESILRVLIGPCTVGHMAVRGDSQGTKTFLVLCLSPFQPDASSYPFGHALYQLGGVHSRDRPDLLFQSSLVPCKSYAHSSIHFSLQKPQKVSIGLGFKLFEGQTGKTLVLEASWAFHSRMTGRAALCARSLSCCSCHAEGLSQ
jgi:hypothetical protein